MTDIYIETCTIHDDTYLTPHEIYLSRLESGDNSGKSYQCGGGFSLDLKNDNRFIIWRIIGNKLELIEHSLASKLNSNFKRIYFRDANVIPRVLLNKSNEIGTSFNISILFATTSRLFRIILPFNINEHLTTSILSNLSAADFTNIDPTNTFQLNLTFVENTDIFVNNRGEALFAFVLPSNSVCCVQMSPIVYGVTSSNRPLITSANSQSLPIKFEINQPNLVKRLWSGFKRGSGVGTGSGATNNDAASQFASFRFFQFENATYLLSLCKDLKIRIWCIKSNQCVHIEDLIKYFPTDANISWDESKIEIVSYSDNSDISVVISYINQINIFNFKIELNDSEFQISEVSRRNLSKAGNVINVQLTRFNTWLITKTESETTHVRAIPFKDKNSFEAMPNDILVVDNECYRKNDLREVLKSQTNKTHEESDSDSEDEESDEERLLLEHGYSDLDQKEAFLKLIFEPFRFSKSNIIKSLGILGQQINENAMENSVEELKEKIVRAIEKAIQSHPSYSNCTEDEFLSLNFKFWSKYYTMLKQYDYDSRIPIGFFTNPSNESVTIMIRKNSISLYSKADLSQYYHVIPLDYIQTTFVDFPENSSSQFQEDSTDIDSKASDWLLLFKLFKIIENHTSLLGYTSSGDSTRTAKLKYIQSLTHDLTITNQGFLEQFCKYFNEINNTDDISNQISMLVDLFDVEKTKKHLNYLRNDDEEEEMETDSFVRIKINSEFTINSILASFKELIIRRCEFFRSVCLFLSIVAKYYETLNISSQVANDLYLKHFENCLNYLNSFEYLNWLCEIYPNIADKSIQDKNIRRTVDLLDDYRRESIKSTNQLLLKSFLIISDCFSIPSDSINVLSLKNYSQLSVYILANILHFVWPMIENFDLIRFFMHNMQYAHLNNFCMQTKWWPIGKNLRLFLLGNCCLFFNNIDQSITYFLRASFNLDKDHCLVKFMGLENHLPSKKENSLANNRRSILINKRTAEKFSQSKRESIFYSSSVEGHFSIDSENQLLLDYYTRCIHYYDLNGNVEAAIELIQTALDQSQFDVHCKSKLYCILFKSYMELEEYDRAHNALMSSSDIEWKKHSLKHFAIELCQKRKTKLLVNFEYGDMLIELISLLYKRAQTTDLRTESGDEYYKVLYSIYFKQKDFRRAAFCLYECAQRLKRDINGIESLQRQEKCLLACLNLLRLVDKKFRWLAVINSSNRLGTLLDESVVDARFNFLNNQMSSNENSISSHIGEIKHINANINIDIADYDEINRNYIIVNYMIRLSKIMSNQSTIADEIISLMIKYSLFDDAITLCQAFKSIEKSPLVNIITGLVDRCCDVNTFSSGPSTNTGSNQTSEVIMEYEILKYNQSLTFPVSPYENPCNFKWKLLILYLEKFNDILYYKVACKRLITLGFEIPPNIVSSFKKLNSKSLLQIYIDYGFWSDAVNLVKDYINAIFMNDPDNQFDIKDSLAPNKAASQALLPYTLIDKLLRCLSNETEDMKNVEYELREKINEYIFQVKSASESKIKLKRSAYQI